MEAGSNSSSKLYFKMLMSQLSLRKMSAVCESVQLIQLLEGDWMQNRRAAGDLIQSHRRGGEGDRERVLNSYIPDPK